VIRKYIKTSGIGNKYASLASMSGGLTWEKPSFSDYQVLSRYLSLVIFVMEKFYTGSLLILENIQK
jgi:hypothetical protein